MAEVAENDCINIKISSLVNPGESPPLSTTEDWQITQPDRSSVRHCELIGDIDGPKTTGAKKCLVASTVPAWGFRQFWSLGFAIHPWCGHIRHPL